MNAFWFFGAAILAIGAFGCSDCESEIQSTVSSPGGQWEAAVYTRQCGSAEGWIVKLTHDGVTTEVFQALMPHPTSVEHAKDVVKVRWSDGNHLVISSPTWANPITNVEVQGVIIEHEQTETSYPAVEE